MALVGDVIENVRTLIVDQPQVLPPTVATAVGGTAPGGALPAGTYACQVTQRNNYGETIASAETTGIVVGASNGAIQITCPLAAGAIVTRAYLGTNGAGSENVWVEFTTSPYQIIAMPTNPGAPPQRNSAYNPDTDGPSYSAGYIFHQLNEALKQVSEAAHGIKGYSGVPTTFRQSLYVLQGQWCAITDLWYNGWWMSGGDRGYFFRRNTITSEVLTSGSVSVQDNRTILEIYPQPDRTAGASTLSSGMGATDITLTTTTGGFLLLPFGFVQVDQEIMAYAVINGNTLTGLVRGLGMAPTTHNAGAPVVELNCFFSGRYIFQQAYQPGQSSVVLPVPDGWKSMLEDYMMYRIRSTEQEEQKADQYYKSYMEKAKSYASSTQSVMKRRQVGVQNSPQVFFPTPTGGLLIP